MTQGRGRGGKTKRLPPIFKRENFYLGIELNAEAANRLMALQRELHATLGAENAPLIWVPAPMLRLTLCQLGRYHHSVMEAVEDAGVDALANTRPFSVDLGISAALQPNAEEPEFLWVNAETKGDQLAAVSECVRQMLDELGFSLEPAVVPPHVTLGIVRSAEALPPALIEKLNSYQNTVLCSTTVRELAIYHAAWPQTGPKLEIHRRVRLAGRPPVRAQAQWPGATNHTPQAVIRKSASSQEQ